MALFLLKKKSADICLIYSILMIFSGIGPSQEKMPRVEPEKHCPGDNNLYLVMAYEDSQVIDSASFELIKSFMHKLTSRMLSGVSSYSDVAVAVMGFGDTQATTHVKSSFNQDPLVTINQLILDEARPNTSVISELMYAYERNSLPDVTEFISNPDTAVFVITTTPPGNGPQSIAEDIRYQHRAIMILGVGQDVATNYLQIESMVSLPRELDKNYFLVPSFKDLDANVGRVLNAMCITDPPTTTGDPTTTEIETTELTTETTELTTETTELTTETIKLTTSLNETTINAMTADDVPNLNDGNSTSIFDRIREFLPPLPTSLTNAMPTTKRAEISTQNSLLGNGESVTEGDTTESPMKVPNLFDSFDDITIAGPRVGFQRAAAECEEYHWASEGSTYVAAVVGACIMLLIVTIVIVLMNAKKVADVAPASNVSPSKNISDISPA